MLSEIRKNLSENKKIRLKFKKQEKYNEKIAKELNCQFNDFLQVL